MVIITTLIAKLYFPECLERREIEPQTPRSYAYRMVDGQSDIMEDDELIEVEEDEYLDSDGEREEKSLMHSNNSSSNMRSSILDFNQESMSKAQVLKRLFFCIFMLNTTFVIWGLIQERMLTRRYPRLTGEYFTYSYALVFTNRFWTLIMSVLFWIYLKPRRSRSTVIYEYSFPSISNMLSSWCQYEALRYVSFPATTLFKAFKLAPVMAMGKILGNKTCE
jgi:UAA transporter family